MVMNIFTLLYDAYKINSWRIVLSLYILMEPYLEV